MNLAWTGRSHLVIPVGYSLHPYSADCPHSHVSRNTLDSNTSSNAHIWVVRVRRVRRVGRVVWGRWVVGISLISLNLPHASGYACLGCGIAELVGGATVWVKVQAEVLLIVGLRSASLLSILCANGSGSCSTSRNYKGASLFCYGIKSKLNYSDRSIPSLIKNFCADIRIRTNNEIVKLFLKKGPRINLPHKENTYSPMELTRPGEERQGGWRDEPFWYLQFLEIGLMKPLRDVDDLMMLSDFSGAFYSSCWDSLLVEILNHKYA